MARIVPLVADLFGFSDLSLAAVLLVVGAGMGERGKGEVVLACVDGMKSLTPNRP